MPITCRNLPSVLYNSWIPVSCLGTVGPSHFTITAFPAPVQLSPESQFLSSPTYTLNVAFSFNIYSTFVISLPPWFFTYSSCIFIVNLTSLHNKLCLSLYSSIIMQSSRNLYVLVFVFCFNKITIMNLWRNWYSKITCIQFSVNWWMWPTKQGKAAQ